MHNMILALLTLALLVLPVLALPLWLTLHYGERELARRTTK